MLPLILPFAVHLARVSGFMVAAPVLSAPSVPTVIRVGLALLLAVFFTAAPLLSMPPVAPVSLPPVLSLAGALVLVREITVGLAAGLVVRLIYSAVQQAGLILAQQMGMSDADVIDPVGGEANETIAQFLDTTFVILFLAAGGMQLMVQVLTKTYTLMPVGDALDFGRLANSLVASGSAMMLFALKIAAPALGAFLLLALLLAVLARALPEMNILMESFPLRVALGLALAAAMMPALDRFTGELASCLRRAFS